MEPIVSRLKTECMDPAAEAHYQKLLRDWKKDDDISKGNAWYVNDADQ